MNHKVYDCVTHKNGTIGGFISFGLLGKSGRWYPSKDRYGGTHVQVVLIGGKKVYWQNDEIDKRESFKAKLVGFFE